MSIKNDKWSALSMKERADLMNMYITNGISDIREMKKHYNSFDDGGRILDGTKEEEQTLSNEPWYKRLGKAIIEGGQSARDARIGALGAQQVRDLYSEGKDAEAQALAQQYAKANTTGIALASGTLSSNLISDLILGEALTAVDTFIDGDISNLGYNLASNISGEILGHGIGKLLSRVYPKISKEATTKIEALLKRFPEGVESVSSVSKELRDRLIKEGVDPAILTKTNLRKMVYLRGKDLLESDAPAKFAVRTNSKTTNTYNLYHNTDEQIKQVGYVAATPEDGVGKINMIENITEHTPDKVKGVSELGYNTVIKDIGASKNGTVLMQPHKTMRVIDKYPDKVVIANDGEWFNGSKYIGGNPIFQLNSPTYDVPIKYLDDFSVDGLDVNGNFIIDFNKDPLYLHGGKLNLNALGGPLYNKHNPIESFSGSSKIPIVRTGANVFDEGGPAGEGKDTYNHPLYNHAEEAEIYSYLRSKGVPHVQASAIMGNIAVESMLNPEITQIGGGGGYGLIQATDRSRKKAFINYDGQPYEFGSNISPETQRQLDYIIDKGLNTQTRGEWRGNHNIGRASVARRKFLEATDVNKASKIFTENYLRPGKPHTKRRKSMSNYFNDNYGITERALEEFENSFLFQNN